MATNTTAGRVKGRDGEHPPLGHGYSDLQTAKMGKKSKGAVLGGGTAQQGTCISLNHCEEQYLERGKARERTCQKQKDVMSRKQSLPFPVFVTANKPTAS